VQVATWAWATQLTPVAAAVAAACAASCAAIVVASFNSRRRFRPEQLISGAFFGAASSAEGGGAEGGGAEGGGAEGGGAEGGGGAPPQSNGYRRLHEEEEPRETEEEAEQEAEREAAKQEPRAPSSAQAGVQGSTRLLPPPVLRSLSLKALADASAVAGAGAPIGMGDEDWRQLRALQEAHRAHRESSRVGDGEST